MEPSRELRHTGKFAIATMSEILILGTTDVVISYVQNVVCSLLARMHMHIRSSSERVVGQPMCVCVFFFFSESITFNGISTPGK